MRKTIFGSLATIMILASTNAMAADATYRGNTCIPLVPASLHSIESNEDLTKQVVNMMNEAVSYADDPEIINYSRPTFTWAYEAKIACGKAYGYLKSDHRDEQHLNKCECFYERMKNFR